MKLLQALGVKGVHAQKAESSQESFNYLETPKHPDKPAEDFGDKFTRRVRQNPLVPLGLLATVAILMNGIWQMQTGNKEKSQRMMRARVVAQGFTVIALVGGIMWSGYQSKEEKKLQMQKKKKSAD